MVLDIPCAILEKYDCVVVLRAEVEALLPKLAGHFHLVLPHHHVEFLTAGIPPLLRPLVLNKFVDIAQETEVIKLLFLFALLGYSP